MKTLKDWISSQLVSMSLVSSRSSGGDRFFSEEHSNGEFNDQGVAHSNRLDTPSMVPNTSPSHSSDQDNPSNPSVQHVVVENSDNSHSDFNKKKKDPLVRIHDLQVKFLRLLQRLGLSQNNLLVAKVLYRIHLATLIRAEESDLKRVNLRSNRARVIAAEQEAAGLPEIDFSLRILVLGKTGVGKSATINSIFDQKRTSTNAFRPDTDRIREVVGTINGIQVTVIDTPGFLPSSTGNFRRNKKIMLSVKRFIQKCPPDIVLFFERLDLVSTGYHDISLLKLITEAFGPSIWFNTILVMTHSSSALPEGPDGYPVSFESYVRQSTDMVQNYIHQAVSDSRLENPVLLVENHPQCEKNITGEKILPNGLVWKSQFLLLCICTKVLADVNTLLKFQDSIQLGPSNASHVPSLPHLLSSLLRHRAAISPSGVDMEVFESFSGAEEEDEYDQLPPIRILTKSQFERLTKSQKNEYLDELDYRETLYMKKQFKEEYHRQMAIKLSKLKNLASDGNVDSQQASQEESVLLPDMEVPPSFGSNCPAHRYRCLVTSYQWITRPVLDPHGWDNDVCFDGVSLETTMEINRNIVASVAGQMSKEKNDFSIQSECAAAYSDPNGSIYSVGLDVQSAGKDTIYTLHSNTKLRKILHNIADCGVSLTSFGKKCYIGAKLEDTISVGKRLKFVMNAGQIVGPEQVAYGGGVEATFRGKDYPVRNDSVSLTMTILSFNKEMVLGGNLQSESRLGRNLRVSVNANLNSRKMGKICIKTSSSDHLQFSMVAAFTVFWALLRKKDAKRVSHE